MRKLMIALATGIACMMPLVGHTLGLGDIEVNSALNQKLDARIKLIDAVPEDTQDLIVKLGTADQFNQAGIDRPYLLQSLKFSTKIIDGAPYIIVTSSKPIREPYLDFLVEIDWPKGELLREYTILLNPPVFNTASDVRPAVAAQQNEKPAASSQPAMSATSNVPPPEMGANVSSPTPAPAAQNNTQSGPNSTAVLAKPAPQQEATSVPNMTLSTNNAPAASNNSDYRIKKGDTAWSLANALRPDQSITTQQMLVALVRSNPESFIKGNVNGLKRGYILRIPDRSEIEKISQAEAIATVNKQNALWQQYEQALSGSSSVETGNNSATTTGTKSDQTKTAAAGSKTGAHLTIVSAGKGAGAGADDNVDVSKMTPAQLRSQLELTQEQLASTNLENKNLKGHVGDLQKQVDKMKRLLNIENKGMAEVESTTKPETANKTAAAAPEAKPQAEKTATPAATTKPAPEKPAAPATKPAMPAEKEKATASSKPEATPAPAAVVKKKPTPPPAMPQPVRYQQRSFISTVLDNPKLVGAMGGALLLLAALVYMLVKRRRSSTADTESAATDASASDDDLASVADMLDDHAVTEEVSDDEVETTMAAAEEEAEKFDSDATMVIPPSADDTVITQAEEPGEEARDDVIAEADVYLAYGIYQQAEELLQNAIKDHPDNDAYRMKLAETYFAGKNANGFAELAADMHERTNGSGSRWQKLVAMGKELVPDNALFKGETADVALDDIVPSPEPMDIDLGLDDTGGMDTPDLDLGLGDGGELELPSADEGGVTLDFEDEPADTAGAPLEELEFDLSETDAVDSSEEVAEAESLDFDMSELGVDLDEAGEAGKDSASASDLDFDLDLSGESESDDAEEFDIDISEEVEATATVVTTADELASGGSAVSAPDSEADAMDIDIDMGLDLSDNDAEVVSSADEEEADIDLSDLEDVDEVSTKLDLARAYLDMGDNEGTRSILEEVIADGNAEQKAEAEKLLSEING